jgi:hypothetical protein
MKTIWKYGLSTTDRQTLLLPQYSEILTAQVQDGNPALWVLVDTEIKTKVARVIEIFGTGNPIDDVDARFVTRKYIGTYQLLDSAFVGHVFERIIL